jgi:predicted transcriptional regulator
VAKDSQKPDRTLENLLVLDGDVLFIDDQGHWAKFEVRRVAASPERPQGIEYSLTLHDSSNQRLAGFDNAHAVRKSKGPGGGAQRSSPPLRNDEAVQLRGRGQAHRRLLGVGRSGIKGKEREAMSTLRVGIASYEQMKKRTLAIARGQLKPGPQEPKVWFTSTESMARVLSAKNRDLLETIRRNAPQSLAELAEQTGRKAPNLSRTLKTMQRYGLVKVRRKGRGRIVPKVPYKRVAVVLELGA